MAITFNKKIDKYEYFESSIDNEYYFISNCVVLIDKNKNIISESNINHSPLNNKIYDSLKKYVDSINLDNIEYNYIENVIYIQHWFSTYGHFKDEIFNLCNFYHLLNNPNYKILMSYEKSPNINYSVDNYDLIKDFLFEPNILFNTTQLKHKITKIKKLILIKHNLTSDMFHMFPKYSINKVLSKIDNKNTNNNNNNIFVTRGKALHMPRNLDNQEEIEKYFLSIGYDVINPELMNILTFINNIKNANNIYITWGGAMVNLCYVNPKANIYLLQSLSYLDENIFTIFKFLRNYENLYLIKCDNNKIDLKKAVPIKLNYK